VKVLAKGNSMYPTMKDSYEYEMHKVDFKEIKTNDVIVFRTTNEKNISHRVVKVIKTQAGKIFLETKGDNCDVPDPFVVDENMILGKIDLKSGRYHVAETEDTE